jgi:hypothetical protein
MNERMNEQQVIDHFLKLRLEIDLHMNKAVDDPGIKEESESPEESTTEVTNWQPQATGACGAGSEQQCFK